jgi:hypothetical protein
VPNFGPRANRARGIDVAGFMYEVFWCVHANGEALALPAPNVFAAWLPVLAAGNAWG